MKVRTCATFASESFNTRESRPEYRRRDNYGDDLARWFMEQMQGRGMTVDETGPDQEDHGWYLSLSHQGRDYDLVVTYLPGGEEAKWLASIERGFGLLGSMLGRRHRAVEKGIVELVHRILVESIECTRVRWHYFEDVAAGHLDVGTESP